MKLKEKLYGLQLPKERVDEELLKIESESTCEHKHKDHKLLVESEENDLPISFENDPYKKKMHQCVFCKYNVPLDYKNTQLLSQFVSPHTGLVYSQEVTGLCIYKYKELEETVFKARRLGLMPFFYKETLFVNDPELFDPYKNNLKQVPNNYDRRKLNADSNESQNDKKNV